MILTSQSFSRNQIRLELFALVLRLRFILVVCGTTLVVSGTLYSEVIKVAVAANFSDTVVKISQGFQAKTGHELIISKGSTGQLYTQIIQGAPFDVFLSADTLRPEMAEQRGLTIQGTRFTYAVGRLVIYSTNWGSVIGPEIMDEVVAGKIAIANPSVSPYGAASMEVINNFQISKDIKTKFIKGNNVAQVFQFVATGNVDIGFIALSQISLINKGSWWLVPEIYHTQIGQAAVLLRRARMNAGAFDFMDYLKSSEAKQILREFGYQEPENG